MSNNYIYTEANKTSRENTTIGVPIDVDPWGWIVNSIVDDECENMYCKEASDYNWPRVYLVYKGDSATTKSYVGLILVYLIGGNDYDGYDFDFIAHPRSYKYTYTTEGAEL